MFPSNAPNLRDEIAAAAARMIAEDGLDYAGAKRRAAREVLGDADAPRDCLPDNDQVQAAVREHQALFMSDTQPARLDALRRVARDVMRFLVDAGLGLAPFVTGAIVNGTAGEHSDVHLQVFDDNAKDLEIHLLNAGIDFEVSETGGSRAGGEVLSFLWPPTFATRRIAGGGASERPRPARPADLARHRTRRPGSARRVDRGSRRVTPPITRNARPRIR